MAQEKNINSRIQQKHDIEANWLKATNFIPKIGEIIIYDKDENYDYIRIKIGDGINNPNNLDFYSNSWNDLKDKPSEDIAENIQDSIGKKSLKQAADSKYTGIAIVTKNPNAAALDTTLTDNEPIGATGDWATSLGGVSSAQGKRAVAEGTNTIAKGKYSHAEGDNSVALGDGSHAEGGKAVTKGMYAHAEGVDTRATAAASHAEGNSTVSSGEGAHAEGTSTIAAASSAHAEGYKSEATGNYSHAEGTATVSEGWNSHAEGSMTLSQGESSHAEGANTEAIGDNSHAEGKETKAIGFNAHAEGFDNEASGESSHAEGRSTMASNRAAHAEGENTEASGIASHAEGANTKATHGWAHAEGANTKASAEAAHAEGNATEATSNAAHAEGNVTHATGIGSHAEGTDTHAEGNQAHAEGTDTHAKGESSHAEGISTAAEGRASHAGGYDTVANAENSFVHGETIRTNANAKNSFVVGQHTASYAPNQLVVGKWNKNEGSNLFEVGCGESDETRANAFSAGANVDGKFIFIGDTKLSEAELTAMIELRAGYDDTIAGLATEAYADNAATTAANALKSDLLNGAGGAYDTLKELGDLIDDNKDAIDALEIIAAGKANVSDLTAHTGSTSNPHSVTAAQVGAVPTSRTVNGKALSSNITLTASNVGARPDTWVPTASDLGFTGGASSVLTSNLTASRAVVSNSSGKLAASAVTATELGYLDGVTSSVQTQLNDRLQLTIGTVIASNSNLNDFKTPGKYYCASGTVAATLTNAPSNAAGFGLIVTDGYIDGRVYQIAMMSNTSFSFRYFNGSAWASWRTILTNVLTSSTYGTSLPTAGTAGRIFFKKVT